MGFFPVDKVTLDYLLQTGRTRAEVELVERYNKEQLLFHEPASTPAVYTKHLKLDLSTIEPSLAGPKRPQDRVPLTKMQDSFRKSLSAPIAERGYGLEKNQLSRTGTVSSNGHSSKIGHGAVVIAAITSCTNTSNPSVMVAAGLLARKAVEKGLSVEPWVKTSLAPGSRVVTDYLKKAGLDKALDQLGFQTVGYGCTSCIGNSGPLPEPVAAAIAEGNLVASAVLSGNRNFEGRVNPLTRANYLASPPLVVAYALAGTTDIDIVNDPLGQDKDGNKVFLRDIWPTQKEIRSVIEECIRPEMYSRQYANAFDSNEMWNAIPVNEGTMYDWDESSTYIQEPPFMTGLTRDVSPIQPLTGARCLALLGDSVTTDHISPAGSIARESPAGRYLREHGVEPADFNSYGSRRGNDRVMVRGTFANIRIRNQIVPGIEGGMTRFLPEDEVMPIYDAATRYRAAGIPLIVIAGAEYGTGSSRDWAAKGTLLLGVRAVIAASYERIHRSNLVGMGILPLQFADGQTWQSLGLDGTETFDFPELAENIRPRSTMRVVAWHPGGRKVEFDTNVRIDTPVEVEYYAHGGILQKVVRDLLRAK